MRLHKLAIMGLALAMTLIIAACDTGNGDDEDTNGVEDPVEETDNGEDEEPTVEEEATDEEATPEDGATEDEATPEATEEDDTTGDDTEGMGEQESAQVTIGSDELTIEQDMMGAEDGMTDEEATPEATDDEETPEATDDEETPEATDDEDEEESTEATDDEETPEATDDEETPEATDDEEDDMTGMNGEMVTFSSGSIMFEVTNDADSAFSLAIEESGGAMGETDDEATPEATDDEETPEATDDEETPEATDDEEDSAGMNGDSMAVEELGETVDAGSSTEWEVELEPGDYVMYVVSEDGEREEGMEAEFTVEEGGMMNGADDEATPEATEDEETPEATEDEETPEATDDEDDEEEDEDES